MFEHGDEFDWDNIESIEINPDNREMALRLAAEEAANKAREAALAADDAMDAYYSYTLHRDFGVDVVCNPGGDRSLIQIDGVTMDQRQFAQWLQAKMAGEDYVPENEDDVDDTDDVDDVEELTDDDIEDLLRGDDDVSEG